MGLKSIFKSAKKLITPKNLAIAAAVGTGGAFLAPALAGGGALSGMMGSTALSGVGKFLTSGTGTALLNGGMKFAAGQSANRANASINRSMMTHANAQQGNANEFTRDMTYQAQDFERETYNRNRADAVADYDRQRAHGLAEYRMQRNHAKQDQASQFVDLRDAAARAGFNPLTAMGVQSPGSSMIPSLTTPGMASIGSSLMGAASGAVAGTPGNIGMAPAAFDISTIAGEFMARETEIRRKALEVQAETQARDARGNATVVNAAGVPQPAVRTEPYTRAELDEMLNDTVPMTTSSFDSVMIPRKWMQEADKSPGDLWTIEDMEQIGGEIASEIIGALNAPAITSIYFDQMNSAPSDDWWRPSNWLPGRGSRSDADVPAPARIPSTGSRSDRRTFAR